MTHGMGVTVGEGRERNVCEKVTMYHEVENSTEEYSHVYIYTTPIARCATRRLECTNLGGTRGQGAEPFVRK